MVPISKQRETLLWQRLAAAGFSALSGQQLVLNYTPKLYDNPSILTQSFSH
jgi:hypothetical protein